MWNLWGRCGHTFLCIRQCKQHIIKVILSIIFRKWWRSISVEKSLFYCKYCFAENVCAYVYVHFVTIPPPFMLRTLQKGHTTALIIGQYENIELFISWNWISLIWNTNSSWHLWNKNYFQLSNNPIVCTLLNIIQI